MTNQQDPDSPAPRERQPPSEQQTQIVQQPQAGPQPPPGPQQPPGFGYAAPDADSQQWTAQPGVAPGYPPPAPYGAGFVPMPPQPSFFARLPRPALLALAASVAGVITFFMGFLGWISISSDIERKAENWSTQVGDTVNIPAYLTPSLVLSPGWFFLLLGAVAVASAGLVAPKLRRFLPHLAFASVVGWLGLFVCALGLPPFISLGVGAYIALILGFAQAALLVVAAVLDGMEPDHPAAPPMQQPFPPAPPQAKSYLPPPH